jgi:NitT/TauT family transport system permease protein
MKRNKIYSPMSKHKQQITQALVGGKERFSFPQSRWYHMQRTIGINLLAMGIIMLIWQLVALWISHSRGITFPSPLQTSARLLTLFSGDSLYDQSIYQHLSASLTRWATGYLLAVFLGIVAGLILGSSARSHEIFMPIVHVLQLIPGLAWIPIALLLFGLGDISTIFMIFIMGVTPIIINTAGGIRGIPPIYIKSAQMMGAGRILIFFRIMLPAATLAIIGGLRIGLANSWRVLIAAEMIVGAGVGLGYAIIQSRWSLDFEAAFVCVMIICLVGLVVEKLVFEVLEKRIMVQMGLKNG